MDECESGHLSDRCHEAQSAEPPPVEESEDEPRKRPSVLDQIIRYENGEMDEDELISFFQRLVDTGLAWKLQGHYGRTAKRLIDAGLVESNANP